MWSKGRGTAPAAVTTGQDLCPRPAPARVHSTSWMGFFPEEVR